VRRQRGRARRGREGSEGSEGSSTGDARPLLRGKVFRAQRPGELHPWPRHRTLPRPAIGCAFPTFPVLPWTGFDLSAPQSRITGPDALQWEAADQLCAPGWWRTGKEATHVPQGALVTHGMGPVLHLTWNSAASWKSARRIRMTDGHEAVNFHVVFTLRHPGPARAAPGHATERKPSP